MTFVAKVAGMDFATRLRIGPWQVSMVSIAAVVDLIDAGSDLSAFLSEAERARLTGLRIAKRRREWLAGRLAAKDALARLRLGGSAQTADLAAIAVGSRDKENGRGQPVAGDGEYVSISHSHGYAAAVASHRPVGVDIERVRLLSVSAQEVAFTARERERAFGAAGRLEEARQTIVWTFKEAFMKAHGQGVFGAFADLELEDVAIDGRLSWRVSPDLTRRLGVEEWSSWCGFSDLGGDYALSVVGRHPCVAPQTVGGLP